MRKSRKIMLLMTIVFILIIQVVSYTADLPYHLYSESGLPLNITISQKYKIEVFGDPFGRDDLPNKGFLVDENGWITNEKDNRASMPTSDTAMRK